MAAVLAVLVAVAGAGAQVHSPVLGAATQVRRDYTVHSHNKQVNTGNNDNNRTETCSTPPLPLHCLFPPHCRLETVVQDNETCVNYLLYNYGTTQCGPVIIAAYSVPRPNTGAQW